MSNDVGRRFYLGYVLMEVTGAGAFDQWVAVREVDTGKTTQRTVTEVRRLIAKHDNDQSLVRSRGQVVASALKAHPEMSEGSIALMIDNQIDTAVRTQLLTTTEQYTIRHELKTWPAYFQLVQSGRKQFDLRKDDRNFHEGDVIALREWSPMQGYSGAVLVVEVTCVIRGAWLAPGMVALGIKVIE